MASGITLSAGVRQNLLSLQNTASMMASTQNRLATGKKVNSALDNPSNFFTSQTLQDRAGDLNSLLDSIGQATKTLDAANNGLTSLTKLVQSAKSIAQQARSATGATETFASVGSSSNILSSDNLNGAESVASVTSLNDVTNTNLLEAQTISITGAALAETVGVATGDAGATINTSAIDITGASLAGEETLGTMTTALDLTAGVAAPQNGQTLSFDLTIRGVTSTFTSAALTTGDDNADVAALIGAATNGTDTVSDFFTVAGANGLQNISITSLSAENDMTITASAHTAALGLTGDAVTNTAVNSNSLLDSIITAGGASGETLTIGGTGATGTAFTTQTITFGTAAGQVNTVADLNTRLGIAAAASAGAFTASVTGNAIQIDKAAGAESSITVGGTLDSGAQTLLEGATAGTVFGTHNSNPTVANLALGLSAGKGGSQTISGAQTLSFSFNNATAVTVDIDASDRIDDVISKINADGDVNTQIVASKTTAGGGEQIVLTALDSEVDFSIGANAASAALGLTTSTTLAKETEGGSLFNQLRDQGAVDGDTMTITGTKSDGSTFSSTLTFGDGNTDIKSISDLNTALQTAATNAGGAFSANITGGQIRVTMPASDKGSVTFGGTIATVAANAADLEGAIGNLFGTHNSQKTLGDLGTANGEAGLTNGGGLNFTVNNKSYTVGLSGSDRLDDVLAKLNSSSVAANLTFSKETDSSGHDHIKIDAKDASVDFTINANASSKVLGLTHAEVLGVDTINSTTASVNNSTSLLDMLDTSFGSAGLAQGKTLTVAADGGKAQTITFGTGTNQVQTLDQLNTKLAELSGVTAEVSDTGSLSIQVASGTKATSLEIGGTAAAKLGLTAGIVEGDVISTTASTIRTNLQSDFNNVLDQIDALTKDASYNGINLLNGDDLKVTFNENGSSSLTIQGVTFDSNNLGMNKVKGDTFQDNTQIDERISAIDTALSDLRSQGSKFGSNLSTVQTRQEFTKNMINTLQTGGDALVLADTNEEGANLLALQTRQQLSTTALSMSAQQDQAVLRLF